MILSLIIITLNYSFEQRMSSKITINYNERCQDYIDIYQRLTIKGKFPNFGKNLILEKMAYDLTHKKQQMDLIYSYMAKGQSITKALSNNDVSCGQRTFWTWLTDSQEFQHDYARAEVERGLFMFEETETIANDNEGCKYFNEKVGAMVFDSAAVRNKEVILNNRRWFLSKFLPRKYADKILIDTTHTETRTQGINPDIFKPDTLALIERDILADKQGKSLTGAILSTGVEDVQDITDKED